MLVLAIRAIGPRDRTADSMMVSNVVATLDWDKVKARYRSNPISRTKRGRMFRVSRVTETAVYVDLPSKEEPVSRRLLEKAVGLVNQGRVIEGPADYKRLVGDERPSYAWTLLRDLGFVEE